MNEFLSLLNAHAQRVEECLVQMLSDTALPDETKRPGVLIKAMRHSALEGGKRLRPFLLMETARLFGVNQDQSVGY